MRDEGVDALYNLTVDGNVDCTVFKSSFCRTFIFMFCVYCNVLVIVQYIL